MTDAIVGKWLYDEITQGSRSRVYQEKAVYEIKNKFGDNFVYYNENGNLAISKTVLKEFNKLKNQLSIGKIVWDRSDRAWVYKK